MSTGHSVVEGQGTRRLPTVGTTPGLTVLTVLTFPAFLAVNGLPDVPMCNYSVAYQQKAAYAMRNLEVA